MGEFMTEKTCPQCAEKVKAEAKICRFCQYNFETGANGDVKVAPVPPAKKKGLGKGCLVIVGIIVVLMVIGAIAGGDQKPAASNATEEKAEAAPARAVTAKELAQAYDANEAAAKKEYGDQRLSVTGVVAGVDLDFTDDPVVKLDGINQFMPVQASFEKDYSDATAALKKGQKITVTCDKLTEVIGTPMLDDCTM
jgi:hypothetical protein